MPLVAPFRTSFGTETERDVLLRARRDAATPRAGASASRWPTRSTPRSTSTAAADVLRRFLIPRAGRAPAPGRATRSRPLLAPVQGPPDGQGRAGDGGARRRAARRRAARSAASSARSTTACRAASRSGSWTRIPELLDAVGGYLDEGYVRIKLKIEPGWDVEPVRAVRERFGDDVLLQVDANTAYTLADAPAAGPARPLRPAADRAAAGRGGHARPRRAGAADHARRSASTSRSVSARVGRGRDPAGRLPDRQHQAGPGRRLPRGAPDPRRLRRRTASRSGAAACSRPASAGPRTSPWPRCPGFTLPGDTSASDRYYAHRHHRAVRAGGRPPRRCRPDPGSASSRCRTGSPRSPPARSG